MAVFNGSRFLSHAVDSVLNQTLRDFEFVIVNDGSTDSSRAILEAYANKDHRIKFIDRPHAGNATSLNTAIENASHELIAVMDADDVMMPNRLERQLSFMMTQPNISVACSHAYFIDIKGKTIGISQNAVDVSRGRNERNPQLFSEIVHPSALMRKKDILQIGGYRDVYFCSDRDLWGRLVTGGFDIRCQPETLLGYRLHLGAASGKTMRRNALYATYCDANVVRRLQGREELSFDSFLVERKQRSLRAKLDDYRKTSALMHYKRSTRYRGECLYGHCMFSLALAAALDPFHVLKRTWTKWATDKMSKRAEPKRMNPAE
jgi:glycosyltransferase involved in cell wall biosynthesis